MLFRSTERERADALFFWINDFNKIRIPPRALEDPATPEAAGLVERMRAASGAPLPQDIDQEFQRIAARKTGAMSFGERFSLWAAQAWSLWERWFNPYIEEVGTNDPRRAIPVFSVSAGYQVAITALFLFACALSYLRRGASDARFLCAVALVFIVSKSIFLVMMLGLENRYTVTILPFVEAAIALALGGLIAGRGGARKT